MTQDSYHFNWSDLAFGSKKEINALNAIFIMSPREMSSARFIHIVKTYLPKGNIILGLAKEPYVLGLEDQPHFKMLQASAVQHVINQVNSSNSVHKIYTVQYFQRETKYLFEKVAFQKVLLVNGSWKYAFHTQENYYALVNQRIPYEMISPFTDEAEAKEYEKHVSAELMTLVPSVGVEYTEGEMLEKAAQVAKLSFDYSFQTGAVLGKKVSDGGRYTLLTYGFNKVVPYQTYAMHHGASREKNFSPPHDLNHYDTNHAEMEVLIRTGKQKIDLEGTTLFVNLMPCPTCARSLSQTSISEIVYSNEHSSGYAIDLLRTTGKIIRNT